MDSIQAYRDFYANFIVNSASSKNKKIVTILIAAFSSVEREHYLGKGPWPVFAGDGYLTTISDDPRLLYQNILIGLCTKRGINNGQPSLHASCLATCAPVEGETVVHIGAGTGYYTAILAALVGASGSVIGYEIENDLAEQARENLKHLPNVKLVSASATEETLPSTDVIYVNAGATHPLASWLDALKIGGRLLFPLTPNEGPGCLLMVTRTGSESYAASIRGTVMFIPCIGARDEATSQTLTAAIEQWSLFKTVRSCGEIQSQTTPPY